MDKNIMKKAEDYIKPVTFDSQPIEFSLIAKIRERYDQMRKNGKLEKELHRLERKQKNATTTNGPHPHYQSDYGSRSNRFYGGNSYGSKSGFSYGGGTGGRKKGYGNFGGRYQGSHYHY